MSNSAAAPARFYCIETEVACPGCFGGRAEYDDGEGGSYPGECDTCGGSGWRTGPGLRFETFAEYAAACEERHIALDVDDLDEAVADTERAPAKAVA